MFGYTVSTRFYPSIHGSALDSASAINKNSPGPIQTLNNGQRSLLLIWVDSMETSKPELISLWLISYLPSNSTVQFLPIFPTGDEILSDWDNSLVSSFSVDRLFDLNTKNIKVFPGQKFTKFLEESNYWWSGYFIFDQSHIDSMLDLVKNESSTQNLSGNQVIQSNSGAFTIPAEVNQTSFSTLQSICQKLSDLSSEQDISQVITKLSVLYISNLDVHQILQEWDGLLSKGSTLNCEFPTFQGSMLTH